MNKKRAGAIFLGLTMGLTGTVCAAPEGKTDDISSRIAAIEAQQQQLAEQLAALKAENSKLKADKTETDSKIKEAKDDQERLKLYGYIRASWDNDTARNKGNAWSNEKENSRYYLNLNADLKINDQWTGHFQSETNHSFAHNTAKDSGNKLTPHQNGTIQRIWLDGNLKNGLQVSAGRKWSPLGMQFSLLGCTTSGIDVSYPITKQGLRAGAFYYAMAEYDNADFSLWGPTLKGPIGHNFDINLAYAKLNIGKDSMINKKYEAGTEKSVYGDRAFVISGATNVAKNLRLTADYVRTNYEAEAGQDNNNQSILARLDYKWTNPSVVGSFGAYLRYHTIQAHGNVWADDAWGSLLKDSKGWTVGVKYVPAKNIEWETFFQWSDCNMSSTSTDWWADRQFTRRLFRTQIDYHF